MLHYFVLRAVFGFKNLERWKWKDAGLVMVTEAEVVLCFVCIQGATGKSPVKNSVWKYLCQ